jgi:zinc protease
MKRIIQLFLLAAIAVGSVNVASAHDPNKKPAPGPVPKAVFPPFSETTLKNGIRVIIVEDHKQPIVWHCSMQARRHARRTI